ncbi:hypothetical protein PFLUV_G00157730 [Perca fluviatilis]|uniref:UPAR/Ly6 domain-containing protein n=1 Tax=Perca fluviatilis TaxID=8168 RepID=A0A6A5E0A0_PERFL|nr:sperm acrosome membrane-associated protein 4 [Perca fluviatilis]KAF1381797.1 hypothetical protein PFLUV_G00157730 [Perca fluviatilis]
MNRIILQLFALGFCFAVVQALTCYKCEFGVGNFCITSQTTCDSGELCFSGVAKAVGVLDIKKKGCSAVAKCNGTEQSTVGGNTTVYSLTTTCCNTDLCNAAPGLPGTSALSLALATITALFVANVLV